MAALGAVTSLRADTTLVFNEISYHAPGNEISMEWVELYNQMAVDLDISGWSLDGGIQYTFPSNTIARGGGFVVVSVSPASLEAMTGLPNIFGPFTGRLNNGGDTLQLRNNSGRLVDQVTYAADVDWPVAPDGSGVTLAKLDHDTGSGTAGNWTWSEQVGGTPGADNFPFYNNTPAATKLVATNDVWTYNDAGMDLGTAWRNPAFDDSLWPSQGVLDTRAISTLFSTGLDTNGNVLPAGSLDPHYLLTAAAQGAAPTNAMVQANNAAWLANDTGSAWLGVTSSGSDNVSVGVYNYRTTFSLNGFNLSTVQINVSAAVDNDLTNVVLNGVPTGIAWSGFTAWNGPSVLSSGFVAGTNTLDFLTDNGGTTANPYGFRALLSGTGMPTSTNAPLASGRTAYYFRKVFVFNGDPAATALKLNTLLADGAVFYLNGVEVYRQNMPTGLVSYPTSALSDVTTPAFSGLTAIPASSLVVGTNVLAVEVHQASGGVDGALLKVELDSSPLPTNSPVALAFNEFSATTNQEFWLEIVNYGSTPLSVDGCVIARDTNGPFNHEYVFPSNGLVLAGGSYLALTNTTLGFSPASTDKLYLYSPDRTRVFDAVNLKQAARARFPDGTGPWLHPSGPTPGASNQFAFHTEIVINEIMYQHALIWTNAGTTNASCSDSPERWLELYNRSANTVNLTGWQLDGGIHYFFPTNKTIAPGAYLVVAGDAAALRVTYPSIDIIGNYGGNLSGNSDLIVLRDPDGNPANQVRYFDGAPWPDGANGGGSSLELRDPLADNSHAEAWAASDETRKTSWQTYTYRMVAAIPTGNGQPTVWNDFVFGLLDAGECLLDDLSVVATSATNTALVGNGNFENGLAGWRAIGTHTRCRVEVDPDNAGNHVLHVIASGQQEHMHNHVETTLLNGAVVTSGVEYQISFRARWLTGNNLLNTRLYFNRCGRTTVLPMPSLNGTPGARNSRYESNIGPTFSQFGHQAVIPQPGEPVTVSVLAQDPQGVSRCEVWWSTNTGAWSSALMTNQGGNRYAGTIPGYPAWTIVQFYVRAVDGLGAASTYPLAGPDSGALYAVADGQANLSLGHNVRLVLTPANTALLHAMTNVMSNDELPTTVIYDEKRAYYGTSMRLKSSERGRPVDTRVSYHVVFPRDDLFRGVHPCMLIDRSGGEIGQGPSNKQLEIMVKHMLLRAGNIPGTYADICRVIAPKPIHTQSALLAPRHKDEFIETAYTNGGQGIVWKFELIYYPTTADAYGYKLPNPDSVTATDIQDLGNDKEIYRYNFILKSHRNADDFSRFIPFAKTFNLTGTQLDQATRQVMDVDEWLRTWALVTLCGVNDSYTYGNNHNLLFYLRPSDNKMLAFAWDMDFLSRAYNASLVGDQNMSKIINLTPNLRAFYGHILDIMGSTFNTSYMNYWVSHYNSFCPGQSFSPMLTFIQNRSDFARTTINAAGGNAPFALTGSSTLYQASNVVTISGTAPVQVKTIKVNGADYPVTWNTISTWTIRLAAASASNRFNLLGYDVNGNPMTNYALSVTANITSPMDSSQGNIVINEIMYNPAVSNASYVELFNRSTNTTFDLTGYTFHGLGYDFPTGTLLSPRSYLVLTKSITAFTNAYGTNVTPFAEFPGVLDTDGETLRLFKQGATPAQDITINQLKYETVAPWPVLTNGVSLQLIDPSQDTSRVNNWSAGGIWTFFSFTGSNPGAATRLYMYLDSAGDVYLDDFMFVPGSVAGVGTNALRNGDFEAPLANTWFVSPNKPYATNSTVSTQYAHAGASSLHLIFTNAGTAGTPTTGAFLYQDFTNGLTVNTTDPYTLSFWYLPTTHATNLTVRTASSAFRPVVNVRPVLSTPGTTNSVAGTVQPYPLLWLNEVQPNNPDGYRDNTGTAQPWVELFNSGTNALSLSNYFLANNFTNLTQWAFPSSLVIGPASFLVVFADGQPQLSTGTVLHTSFRINSTNGSVALSSGQRLLDYIKYTNMPPRYSFGSSPDGQLVDRDLFFYPTPGASNNPASPPITVVINEWMAGNTHTVLNPATSKYDDWFELYNYGTNTVDLSGYYLTQVLTNYNKFQIPSGYTIPPHGFLLVWADKKSSANATNVPDLHVNFKLTKAGDSVGLFAPDGTMMDGISFTNMISDISQGRYPDGGINIYPMVIPTPKGSNVLPINQPPVLMPIPDATGAAGALLTFSASASDSDVPPQSLTFSLDPGAPPGATIDPFSGDFAWNIPLDFSGTAPITVRVTDNGIPALSAAQTFTVTISSGNHPPVMALIPTQYVDELTPFHPPKLSEPPAAGQRKCRISGNAQSRPNRHNASAPQCLPNGFFPACHGAWTTWPKRDGSSKPNWTACAAWPACSTRALPKR